MPRFNSCIHAKSSRFEVFCVPSVFEATFLFFYFLIANFASAIYKEQHFSVCACLFLQWNDKFDSPFRVEEVQIIRNILHEGIWNASKMERILINNSKNIDSFFSFSISFTLVFTLSVVFTFVWVCVIIFLPLSLLKSNSMSTIFQNEVKIDTNITTHWPFIYLFSLFYFDHVITTEYFNTYAGHSGHRHTHTHTSPEKSIHFHSARFSFMP